MTPRLHVRITGRVQGVGFRYATLKQARALKLTGWVRNDTGGSVECLFEGPTDLLEKMLAWCHLGPALADVRAVESQWDETASPHPGFDLRY